MKDIETSYTCNLKREVCISLGISIFLPKIKMSETVAKKIVTLYKRGLGISNRTLYKLCPKLYPGNKKAK